MAEKRICSVDGCDKVAIARGWCVAHYKRWKRSGDPAGTKIAHGEAMRWLTSHVGYVADGCLVWPYARARDGRPYVWFGGRMTNAARAMCELANGTAPTKFHEAAHSCGKGHEGCVNPLHLRWATSAENAADKIDHGTENIGERNGRSKLTIGQVREIRKLIGKMRQRDIAEMFGVTRGAVNRIATGNGWSGVA